MEENLLFQVIFSNFFIITFVLLLPGVLLAHCDTLDGPVAKAAIKALDSENFKKVQIWVGQEQENELRKAFEKVVEVRNKGPKVKELADRYFIETAIRLHREVEGMPYAGVKPAGTKTPLDVKRADKAIETGNAQPVLKLLHSQVDKQIKHWFKQALEAKKIKDEDIEAGRRWVDAYVKFVIYVHGLYKKIQSPPAHGIGEE